MNQYGRLALNHWKKWRPSAFSTIPDPEGFFSTLGQQVTAQVADLQDQIAGPDQAGEDYLEKVGRLRMAKLQAQELVLAELVYLPPDPGIEDDDQTETSDAAKWDLQLHRDRQRAADLETQEIDDAADQEWRERTGRIQ